MLALFLDTVTSKLQLFRKILRSSEIITAKYSIRE